MSNRFSTGDQLFPIANDGGFGVLRNPYDQTLIDENVMGEGATPTDITSQPSYVGLALSEKKLLAVAWAFAAMLGCIVLRAAYVQVANGEDYVRQSENNRSRVVAVPTERGVMYDKNGRPLVRNVPDFSVSVIPADLPKDPAERLTVFGRLAVLLDVTPTDIEQKIREFSAYPTNPITIARNLTHEQAVQISIEEMRTSGVTLVTGTRREYNATGDIPSLSHALGYQGRLTERELDAVKGMGYLPSDLIGKTGLEKSYESVLRGSNGARRIEVDRLGHQMAVISEEPGVAGRNLVLTIDLDLQREVERIFRAQLDKAKKRRGSVIVMNPNNGNVLAMVSEPAFDANAFSKGISTEEYRKLVEDEDHPMFSRAISGEVASGSVFKPVVGAAAMAERTINENTSVLSTGGLRIGAWTFPDWRAGGHGSTNLAKAISESVNTFFYAIGGGAAGIEGLGVEKIVDYARKFGLGSPTGIDLPGEADGFLPSKEWKERVTGEKWYIGDTYHLAIGQGDLIVTPLQIANMTAAFANHGTLYKPRLVSAITTADGERTEREPEVITQQVIEQFAIDAVRKGMRQNVVSGSGRSMANAPVAIAGKTGTAQWNSKKDNHAWFTSFAPYEKPEIVVTVMIEEGVEGSVNATPVAKQIYDWYFRDRR